MALSAVQCRYVTEECVREWRATNSARKILVDVVPARFVFELCQTVVRGELPFTKCRVALDAVNLAEPSSKEETASLLADAVAHLGQELTVPGEFRSRLIEAAKWLVDSGLVPVKLLQERCEAEFLWEAEMIKIKAPDLKSKEVRVNTRLLYQQTKFNLLREESEGYAKLLTLLSQRGPDGLTEQTAPTVISTIKSLIGHFDLDPNRVFDIVLECFELQPDNNTFLELIPLFPKSHTSHILGFKFQYYQRPDVEDPVPSFLYRLAAALIKADCIDLDSIYAHLLPKDGEAFEQYEEVSKKRMDEANRIGKINLAAIGKDLMEDEKPGEVTIDLYAPLDMESEAVAERANELLTNQKLGLLIGFLSVDDWPHAHVLFERLAPLHPVALDQICNGLCRAIEKAIAPYYGYVRPVYLSKLGVPNGGDVEMTPASLPELPRDLFQMLSCIGPYLHRDVLLLQKVCRVLRGYYSAASSSALHPTQVVGAQDNGEIEKRDGRQALKEARLRLEEALGACLLPSLQLLPANPAVGLEIWEVMSLLPYEVRYRLYGEWDKEDEHIPMVLAARQTARLDTRRILKRLAKENLKQLGRMVAKIAHANPMTVLRTIVHQIEAYKDMIAPVVDAFKYLTQLEYDVLEYVVIERLAQSGREKLKDDGLNVSDWLQSLASFWGHLCKKYPSMELRGLFQYLVNQLKKGEGIELILLQELMQQMASVEYTENVTEDQLEAMAGGDAIRYQATAFGVTRNNKALMKSTNRLRDSLLSKDEPKLAVPLLLLIAQQRSHVVVNASAPYIKMVSEQFDRCHGTLLQYVDFLTSAVSPVSAYAQLIPSLDDLVQKYHLEPEVAFLIYRPVMRLFKPHKGSSLAWPVDTSKASAHSGPNKEETGTTKTSSELVLDLGPHRKLVTWSELLAAVRAILPAKAWISLSPELYTTFWGLTLHDLYVPRKRYETEIAKQRAALKTLEESSDNSHAAIAKRKKDKEKIQEVLDRLSIELQKQEANVTAVNQRLVREKDSWLTSCSESLKINMEFLQRCIFPRCVMSMMDAVYCARFVHIIHSLGTPFFNSVNHIDVLICKTLFPMICCCTEFEAGRLGRFLYETLKMAYHWKSEEALYDKECGNMPGFAVLYRDPNSTRVTFGQYVRVHWKWNSRLTKLLIQCLESEEYMEIRNALTVLTKIASVFPVTKKSGVNLERRVSKIKGDEREDLKVLATGVAAALATRKSVWLTDEEFTMGYLEIKPGSSVGKSGAAPLSSGAPSMMLATEPSSNTGSGGGGTESVSASGDIPHPSPVLPTMVVSESQIKGSVPTVKSAPRNVAATTKLSGAHDSKATGPPSRGSAPASSRAGPDGQPRGAQSTQGSAMGVKIEDAATKSAKPASAEAEAVRPQPRRPTSAAVLQVSASSAAREEAGSIRGAAATSPSKAERESRSDVGVVRQRTSTVAEALTNGSAGAGPAKGPVLSAARAGLDRGPQDATVRRSVDALKRTETSTKTEILALKVAETKGVGERDRERVEGNERPPSSSPLHRDDGSNMSAKLVEDTSKERQSKRLVGLDDTERTNKRRKGESGGEKIAEAGELRSSERERILDLRATELSRSDQRSAERDRVSHDERLSERPRERSIDRGRDRAGDRGGERVVERVERDYRVAERVVDRPDRDRGDEYIVDRFRDRSIERFARERSVDRGSEKGAERVFERVIERSRDDRGKDDRSRPRYIDLPVEQPHPDDRFPMQNLPPPPPIPPNVVPRIVTASRGLREEEVLDGRTLRSVPRLSPRRDDKAEKRRSDDAVAVVAMEELKRRRDDEARDRKRNDDRDVMVMKVDKEREREKEKAMQLKEDAEAAAASSKRRRLKRDHLAPGDLAPNFGPAPPPMLVGTALPYEGRDRDRKGGAVTARNVYMEDVAYDAKGPSSGRAHGKDTSKPARREHEQMYEREWEDDKRLRADMKSRRHHRK